MEKKLTKAEKFFCADFALNGSCEAAAKAAGFAEPFRDGVRLLSREDIASEINRLSGSRSTLFSNLAAAGYHRLAFGDISDAVSLLFTECPDPERLAKMDLFLVSEIRRPKDGAMEIKFFDRLKALEKLSECGEASDGVKSLFDAIGRSAGDDGDD